MRIKDLLRNSGEYLKERDIEDPVKEAGLLLSWAAGRDTGLIYAHSDMDLDDKTVERFMSMLERRGNNEPFAYITGECEFYGLAFKIDRSVLIPRADTELLVEAALYALNRNPQLFTQTMFRLPLKNSYTVLDAGTGSGCLAVSLAKSMNSISVKAADISEAALNTAKHNAERQNVEKRVEFIKLDMLRDLQSLSQRFDLLVSNPPYIPDKDIAHLMPQVKDYEPRIALGGGEDGLIFYRSLAHAAEELLENQGVIAVECGFDQAYQVEDLFKAAGMKTLILKDLAGINRAVAAQKQD